MNLPTLSLSLDVFFRLSIQLRAMVACCFVVIVSKLLTLTHLYSAAPTLSNSQASTDSPDKKKKPTDTPPLEEAHSIHNIQLDSRGLTLKLDFLNLSPNDLKVLESLFDYREKLKQKAKEVIKREDQLKIVEERIQQQLKELKRIQGEISGLIDKHDQQEEKKFMLMVKIYETMKPDQAAQIFNTLPEERVLGLLNRMKESKSAPILASMNPSQASHITDQLLSKKELKSKSEEE